MSGHLTSSSSLALMEILGISTEILSSLFSKSSNEDADICAVARLAMGDWLLRMIGVIAGDGIGDGRGVGSSLIGERHLLIVLGISNSIVGGCSRLGPLPDDLCALIGSNTGTSIVL